MQGVTIRDQLNRFGALNVYFQPCRNTAAEAGANSVSQIQNNIVIAQSFAYGGRRCVDGSWYTSVINIQSRCPLQYQTGRRWRAVPGKNVTTKQRLSHLCAGVGHRESRMRERLLSSYKYIVMVCELNTGLLEYLCRATFVSMTFNRTSVGLDKHGKSLLDSDGVVRMQGRR